MLNIEDSSRFCECLMTANSAQRSSIARSSTKVMFSTTKHFILGTQPNRAAPGVCSKTYNYNSMPERDWDHIINVMNTYERAYARYVSTGELVRMNRAHQAVPFQHLSKSRVSDKDSHCVHFGALSFGIGVHLSTHTDADVGWYVATVHLDDRQYKLHDAIIVYFCFPSLGCAVPNHGFIQKTTKSA